MTPLRRRHIVYPRSIRIGRVAVLAVQKARRRRARGVTETGLPGWVRR